MKHSIHLRTDEGDDMRYVVKTDHDYPEETVRALARAVFEWYRNDPDNAAPRYGPTEEEWKDHMTFFDVFRDAESVPDTLFNKHGIHHVEREHSDWSHWAFVPVHKFFGGNFTNPAPTSQSQQ